MKMYEATPKDLIPVDDIKVLPKEEITHIYPFEESDSANGESAEKHDEEMPQDWNAPTLGEFQGLADPIYVVSKEAIKARVESELNRYRQLVSDLPENYSANKMLRYYEILATERGLEALQAHTQLHEQTHRDQEIRLDFMKSVIKTDQLREKLLDRWDTILYENPLAYKAANRVYSVISELNSIEAPFRALLEIQSDLEAYKGIYAKYGPNIANAIFFILLLKKTEILSDPDEAKLIVRRVLQGETILPTVFILTRTEDENKKGRYEMKKTAIEEHIWTEPLLALGTYRYDIQTLEETPAMTKKDEPFEDWLISGVRVFKNIIITLRYKALTERIDVTNFIGDKHFAMEIDQGLQESLRDLERFLEEHEKKFLEEDASIDTEQTIKTNLANTPDKPAQALPTSQAPDEH